MNPFSAKLPEFGELASLLSKIYTQINCGIGCLSSVIVFRAGRNLGLFGCEKGEGADCHGTAWYIDIHFYVSIVRSHEALLVMCRLSSGMVSETEFYPSFSLSD